MADWIEDLNDEERQAWDEFVEHFRRDALEKMTESAFVMSLVPDREHFDVKFAVEVGAAVMLDKPILAVVMPGTDIPGKLELVADAVVYCDVDTEEGREEFSRAISEFMSNLEGGEK